MNYDKNSMKVLNIKINTKNHSYFFISKCFNRADLPGKNLPDDKKEAKFGAPIQKT